MKKNSGVYEIRSKAKPGRCYIGSSVNINKRWRRHILQLQSNCHHSHKLQRHYNKYGEDDLVFKVLEKCESCELLKKEQSMLDILKPYFNTAIIAGSPNKGRRLTQKQSEAQSERQRKRWASMSKEQRKALLKSMHEGRKKIGYTISEAAKEKMRAAKAGYIPWNKGIKYQQELLIKFRGCGPSKQVINVETGILYDSIAEAARAHTISESSLRAHLTGIYKNKSHRNRPMLKLLSNYDLR